MGGELADLLNQFYDHTERDIEAARPGWFGMYRIRYFCTFLAVTGIGFVFPVTQTRFVGG